MESPNIVRLARLARRRLARKEAVRQARYDATRNRVRFFPATETVPTAAPEPGPIAMNAFRAVSIAEGYGDEDADEETQVEAWQFLITSGLAWTLQGSFGRQAASLIEAGICRR